MEVKKMKMLLPHQFKTIGAIIAPLGFAMWTLGQLGYVSMVLASFGVSFLSAESRTLRVSFFVTSLLSLLFGTFFVAFAKEKVEDEMVQRVRLESFMFAALLQIVVVLSFFVSAVVLGEPPRSLMELFAIGVFLLFWVSYVVRFNYTLHFSDQQWKTP